LNKRKDWGDRDGPPKPPVISLDTLGVTRRTFLAAAATPIIQVPTWRAALASRVEALNGPGLLRSYDTQPGAAPFDLTQANTAYVYDNAASGLALLAAGNTAAATSIADALATAQSNDRAYTDGRLRNAYRAGPAPRTGPYPLAGWWDPKANTWLEDAYQAGIATGVLAWTMLLWAALGPAYQASAHQAADFIAANLKAPSGYYGGFIGFEPHPKRLAWVSTEHNIDLAAAFAAIGRTREAAHAAAFVAAMWQTDQGRFAMGLKPDGTLNDASALDANLWPLLSANPNPKWRSAFPWVLAQHGLPAGAPAAHIQGVDFNTDKDGIWLEGTAYMALAAHRLNQPDIAAHMMATLRANTAPTGLVYATTTPTLTTGLATGTNGDTPDFLYFRRPHIGATAWALLANLNASPFPQ
jgi:hypothetical protein